MRQMRVMLVLAAAVLLVGFGNAYAFHAGGVAECGGCHSMHSPNALGTNLLVGEDGSSTCLSCHQQAGLLTTSSYHMSTAAADMGAGVPPAQRTPGGDFGWLRKDYTFTVRGTVNNEFGRTHGHNIIAAGASYGYVADLDNPTAPGGTYPNSALGCASCHNPHGKYRRLSDGTIAVAGAPIVRSGSYNNSADPVAGEAVGVYRLLNGNGYVTDGVTFAGVPPAAAPSTYNQNETTAMVRVAYGSQTGIGTAGHESWGTWCATCHGDMHSTGGNYVHPVDQVLSGVAGVYDSYVKSGDMTGGNATSYQSLVPFAKGASVTDYAGLRNLSSNTNSVLTGPIGSDQVTCLSCHRAHASGFPEMLRWNMEGEFMTYNGSYPDTTNGAPVQFARGRSAAEILASYNGQLATKWATYQRVLCNKCHAQD